MVTIREIAENVGVTVSTVSRALAGHPGLRAETVLRVTKEAQRLGYTPNLMARGLVQKKSGMIGVALPSLDYAHGDFFTQLLIGIEKRAAALKYMLLLFPYLELEGANMMQQSLLDGIMIIGPMELSRFESIHFVKPLVVLDQKLPGVHSIVSANVDGAGQAVRHLVELGHRRLLFLGGPREHPTVQQRMKGFLEAGRKSGDDMHQKCIFSDWTNFSAGGEMVIREIAAGEKFTAVVAANDALAISASLALQEHGYHVP
ncbi:MAG: LacI family DNA-binding transcriptional regulator, partial [Candidatus Hydrogenedentota bacterium]